MKEYIKKFNTAANADLYKIADIPFITSVATIPIQNLACNEKYKKLVNNNGIVTIESTLIPFGIIYSSNTEYQTTITYYAEEGSTFEQWVNNQDLNTDNFIINGTDVGKMRLGHLFLLIEDVSKDTVIGANHNYTLRSASTPY